MNRKLLGGAAALIVAAVAVWFFWLRDRGTDAPKPAAKPDPRSAEVVLPKDTPKTEDVKAPAGVAPRWQMDLDREGPLVLEGQVQGPDGAGVGGATVWLSSVPPRSVKTEADGTFSFDKLAGRTYALNASTDALVGGPVSYKLTKDSDPVVIRLGEGATVVVTVTDAENKPITGALVKEGEEIEAKTDDKGIATIKPVRPGWVSVTASAEGYAPETGVATVGSVGATGSIAIKLRKGYTVSGKVVDEKGKPIAKVQVTAEGGIWQWRDAKSDAALTNDKGEFSVGPFAAGIHTLEAVDGEHAPATSSPITVSDRAITGITITMQPGAVLAGTVVDGQQKPVAFATVRVAGKGANAWEQTARQTTSDDKGAFELRGLARTNVQARAESDTAASAITDVDLVAKTEVTDLKLVLDVTGKISGKVVDDKGQPVAEVQVNAFPDLLKNGKTDGLALAGMSSTTTDGGGAFTVHGVPDGNYRLWAARSSQNLWQEWGQHGTAAKTGDTDVKIVLPAPGGIKGKIAITGAEKSTPSSAFVQIGMQPPTPTGANAAFELRDLSAGTFDVTVRGPEFTETIVRDVKIEPGKTTDMGTISVVRGRRVTGKITDANGPVPGAKVKLGEMLISAEGNESQSENVESMYGIRSTVTDQAGEFVLVGVPSKATTLMAEHSERGRSSAVPIPEGAEDPPPVNLQLHGFGSITGKVTQKGKPLGKVAVSQSTKDGGAALSFTQTAEDGSFTMSKVPEGVVVLQAMQQQMMSMRSASVTVTVTAGKQSNVTIDIPLGTASLEVVVKALPNNQVDAAQVFMFRGMVAYKSGKELNAGFMGGGAQGMKFWMGSAAPPVVFDELVAGDYSVCTIPITGSMTDPTFMQRVQENVGTIKVYCKAVKVAQSTAKQTMIHEVPSMTPFPTAPAN